MEYEAMQILCVDDDLLNGKLVKFVLGEEGYQVTAVGSPEAAFAHLESNQPDLFILDVMMPRMDGFELCRRLRSANSRAAIMFVSARGELEDRLLGLQLGADDYLVKPYEPTELVARVKAVARRSQRANHAQHALEVQANNVELRVSELEVVLHGTHGLRRVSLTPTEMRLLRCLMMNADQVVSRETLLDSIWGYSDSASGSQVIDVYVRRLRKKIEEDASQPALIHSVRGSGYRFGSPLSAPFTSPDLVA